MENHQRQLPEHRGNFGAGAFPDSAGVLCKKYIQRPVQAVLNPPMTASGAGETFDAERQAQQIIMSFELLAALDEAAADDHADGLRGRQRPNVEDPFGRGN